MSENVLLIEGATKRFGTVTAVDSVSLEVGQRTSEPWPKVRVINQLGINISRTAKDR